MKFSAFLILLSAALPTAVSSKKSNLMTPRAENLSSRVNFRRSGFEFHYYFQNRAESKIAMLSCYSLDDNGRERFAKETGSDPVADLSCYLKDLRNPNEYTMLAVSGEGLQFSPAFFWLSDIKKCKGGLYKVSARVRGLMIKFKFTAFDAAAKSATLNISVDADPSATNQHLKESTYKATCD